MKKLWLFLILSLLVPQLAFGAAATYYVTPAGAGNKDGTDWNNAFGLGEFETDMEGSAEAGDVYYLAGGTYTLTQAVYSELDGGSTNPIYVIGVKSGTTAEPPTVADWAYGADRPDIVAGANSFGFDDYWRYYNLDISISDGNGCRCDGYCIVYNTKCYQTGGSGWGFFQWANYVQRFIGVEATGTGATCVKLFGAGSFIYKSYVHDCATGVSATDADGMFVIDTVIDTCTNGFSISSLDVALGSTFYGNTEGINSTNDNTCLFYNNIFDANTTGVDDDTANNKNELDYNIWNNTTDVDNFTKGVHALTADPGLTDPSNGDFTLGSGSPCLDAGLQVGTNTGVVGDYKVNIGVDQDDVTAAGGGTSGAGHLMNF